MYNYASVSQPLKYIIGTLLSYCHVHLFAKKKCFHNILVEMHLCSSCCLHRTPCFAALCKNQITESMTSFGCYEHVIVQILLLVFIYKSVDLFQNLSRSNWFSFQIQLIRAGPVKQMLIIATKMKNKTDLLLHSDLMIPLYAYPNTIWTYPIVCSVSIWYDV